MKEIISESAGSGSMSDKEGGRETDNESLLDWTIVDQEDEGSEDEEEISETTPPDNDASEEEEEEEEEEGVEENEEDKAKGGSKVEEIKDYRVSGGESSDIETLDYPGTDDHMENYYLVNNKLLTASLRDFCIETISNYAGDVDSESVSSDLPEEDKTRKRRSRKPEAIQDEETDLSLVSSPSLPDDLPAIKPEPQYIHTPAQDLNTRLNLIVALTLACVVGLGLGHFLGWSSRCLWEETLNAAQVRKLRELQDNLLSCMSSSLPLTTERDNIPTSINIDRLPLSLQNYKDSKQKESIDEALYKHPISESFPPVMANEHRIDMNSKIYNTIVESLVEPLGSEDTGVIFGDGSPMIESHFVSYSKDNVIKPVKDLTVDGESDLKDKYLDSERSGTGLNPLPIDMEDPSPHQYRGDMFDMFGEESASADGSDYIRPVERKTKSQPMPSSSNGHVNLKFISVSDYLHKNNHIIESSLYGEMDELENDEEEFIIKYAGEEDETSASWSNGNDWSGALYHDDMSDYYDDEEDISSSVDGIIIPSSGSSSDGVVDASIDNIPFEDYDQILENNYKNLPLNVIIPESSEKMETSDSSYTVKGSSILPNSFDSFYDQNFISVILSLNNHVGNDLMADDLLKVPSSHKMSENVTLESEKTEKDVLTPSCSSQVIDLSCSVSGEGVEASGSSIPIELTPNFALVFELKQIIEKLQMENEDLQSTILKLQATNIEPIKIKGKEGKDARELREKINQLISENEDIRLAIARVQYTSLPEANRAAFNEAVQENHHLRTSVAKLTHLGANLDNLRQSASSLELQNRELIANAARVRYEQPMPRELKPVMKEMEGLKQAVIAEARKKKPSANLQSAKSYLIFMNEVLSAFTSLHNEDASVTDKIDSAKDFFTLVVPKGVKLPPEAQEKVVTGRSKLRDIKQSLAKKWMQLRDLTRPSNIVNIAHETLGKMNRVIVNVVNKVKEIGHASIMKQSKKPVDVVVSSLTDRLLVLDQQFDKTWETLQTEILQSVEDEDNNEEMVIEKEENNVVENEEEKNNLLEVNEPEIDQETVKRQQEKEKKTIELKKQMLMKEIEKKKKQKIEDDKIAQQKLDEEKIKKDKENIKKLKKEADEKQKKMKEEEEKKKKRKEEEEKKKAIKEAERKEKKEIEKKEQQQMKKEQENSRQRLNVKESKKTIDFDSHYFKGQYNKYDKTRKEGEKRLSNPDDDDDDEDDDKNWSDRRGGHKGGLRRHWEKPNQQKKSYFREETGPKKQFIRRRGKKAHNDRGSREFQRQSNVAEMFDDDDLQFLDHGQQIKGPQRKPLSRSDSKKIEKKDNKDYNKNDFKSKKDQTNKKSDRDSVHNFKKKNDDKAHLYYDKYKESKRVKNEAQKNLKNELADHRQTKLEMMEEKLQEKKVKIEEKLNKVKMEKGKLMKVENKDKSFRRQKKKLDAKEVKFNEKLEDIEQKEAEVLKKLTKLGVKKPKHKVTEPKKRGKLGSKMDLIRQKRQRRDNEAYEYQKEKPKNDKSWMEKRSEARENNRSIKNTTENDKKPVSWMSQRNQVRENKRNQDSKSDWVFDRSRKRNENRKG